MKKLIYLLPLLAFLLLISCNSGISQKEYYNKINSLCDGYSSDYVHFTSICCDSEKNITLKNEGTIIEEDGQYKYEYYYEYLNKIGSSSDSLVSSESGTITGTKEEVLNNSFSVGDSNIIGLDLKDCFKTHKVTKISGGYKMNGYIAKNTIIKNVDNLDSDIRFNYEISVNKKVTKIKEFKIMYNTINFDSITITINFEG